MSGSNHFKPYQYQELVQPENVVPSGASGDTRGYQEETFQVKTNVEDAAAALKKGHHFSLHPAVADQLGMGERERKATEDRIRKEIERRWEVACEKAEVEGYTKGLEEGRQEAMKAELPRIRERVEKLDHILREFDSFRERIFTANESFLMDLIAQVAGMVALKEVQLDKAYINRLVTGLLRQLSTKDDVKIFLSSQDYANVDELFQFIQKEFGKLSNTTIEASDEIPVGGCKIETRFGVVDASVATQVENVMKSLQS